MGPRPATGSVIEIWDGNPPGSEAWTWRDQELVVDGELMVRNVAVPTLEVFTPTAEPNGTAVIVAPGGPTTSSWSSTKDAASPDRSQPSASPHWCCDTGSGTHPRTTTRCSPTCRNSASTPGPRPGRLALVRSSAKRPSGPVTWLTKTAAKPSDSRAVTPPNGASTPTRIGIVGFSAGGGVAMAAATSADDASRPDFAACLYGKAPRNPAVPDRAPPLFLVHALDDPAVPPDESVLTWQTWRSAGQHAELHLFLSGGHGFGVKRQDLASDAWTLLHESWLRGLGMLDRAP